MSGVEPSASNRVGFGVFLVVTGGVALALAWRIEAPGLPANHDPGPKALPVALALLLIAGGLRECLAAWRARGAGADPEASDPGARRDALRTLGLAGGLILLALALPWTGFALAAGCFVVVFLLASGIRWGKALLAAVILVAAVQILFGLVFRVPLPAGRLGMPF